MPHTQGKSQLKGLETELTCHTGGASQSEHTRESGEVVKSEKYGETGVFKNKPQTKSHLSV